MIGIKIYFCAIIKLKYTNHTIIITQMIELFYHILKIVQILM